MWFLLYEDGRCSAFSCGKDCLAELQEHGVKGVRMFKGQEYIPYINCSPKEV